MDFNLFISQNGNYVVEFIDVHCAETPPGFEIVELITIMLVTRLTFCIAMTPVKLSRLHPA